MSKGDSKARKAEYFVRLEALFQKYNRVLLVGADNVGSHQFHKIRISLRGKAVIMMGKNTMMRKAIRGCLASNPQLEKILPHITGNVGMVFTNDDLPAVRDLLLKERVEAPARAGALAPVDVFVEAQNTGMGPEKTSFFQALGIPTKIQKGTIEILNRQHLIKVGEKVGPSEASLLNMLKISPFTYGLILNQIYDSGTVFPPSVLDITDEDLLVHVLAGIRNVASLSLAAHFPTVASVPHSLVRGIKNVVSLSLATEYSYPLVDKIREDIKKGPAVVAPAAAPAKAAAAPAAAKAAPAAPPPKEESDEDMGFGLFD